MAFVEGLPMRARSLAEQGKGDERLTPQAWSVSGYISHVADNLRTWAERLQGALLSEITMASGYDPDALAAAWKYELVPPSSARWSLENSCDAWVKTLTAARAQKIELEHVTRGRQRAQNIARNNAHDARHNLRDIASVLDA
jgi:fructose-1,6-bisphosphatase/inositol monophosphatase family enzyme